jgi:hypothetical protein
MTVPSPAENSAEDLGGSEQQSVSRTSLLPPMADTTSSICVLDRVDK